MASGTTRRGRDAGPGGVDGGPQTRAHAPVCAGHQQTRPADRQGVVKENIDVKGCASRICVCISMPVNMYMCIFVYVCINEYVLLTERTQFCCVLSCWRRRNKTLTLKGVRPASVSVYLYL